MNDPRHSSIVINPPRDLVKYEQSLVRRGLDDLSGEYSHNVSGSPADAWIREGLQCESKGQHADAVSCFEKALELSPRSVDALRYKGGSLKSIGRLTEAIDSLDICLGIDPSCFGALIGKADVLEALGRFDEAIACYDCANQISPENVSGRMGKGHLLKQLGRYDEAHTCFDKVFEVERPTWTAYGRAHAHSDAWNSKAATFYRMGRYQDAIECCDKAIDLDSEYSQPSYNKGNSLRVLKKFDEAIVCFDRALRIYPGHAQSWNNRGVCLEDLGRLDQSIDCYEKALSNDPPAVLGWYNKASVQEKIGRIGDAINSYENFLAVAPPEEDAQFQYALERLLELKSKTRGPRSEANGYVFMVRDEGAPIEAGTIGYPDIETAILEALKRKRAMHAAGKLSDQAYRKALSEYRIMIKNHLEKRDAVPNGKQ